ncbi:MAG: hypothetical protein WCJ64_08860 [Rhodospirillaceae bacterium]
MSKKIALSLDDDDDVALAERITRTAKQQGIPSLTPPTQEGAKGRRPIKIEVSDHLFEALTIAAAQQRVTKRFLVLSALRGAGFSVEAEDFLEDGRRLRGSRSG